MSYPPRAMSSCPTKPAGPRAWQDRGRGIMAHEQGEKARMSNSEEVG